MQCKDHKMIVGDMGRIEGGREDTSMYWRMINKMGGNK